jgi:hypothetical protein
MASAGADPMSHAVIKNTGKLKIVLTKTNGYVLIAVQGYVVHL